MKKMIYIKPLIVLILLWFGTSFSVFSQTSSGKNINQSQAWKIIDQTRVAALPGATNAQIKKANQITKNLSSTRRRVLLSDSLYRVDRLIKIDDEYRSTYSLIVDRRDSVVYYYDGSKDAFIRQPYDSYFKMVNKDSEMKLMNRQNHPGSLKNILGWYTQKVTFSVTSLANPSDTLRNIIWYSSDLPIWFAKDFNRHDIPGVPMRTITVPVRSKNHLKFIDEAIKIVPITLEPSDYLPPEQAKVIDESLKVGNEQVHKKRWPKR